MKNQNKIKTLYYNIKANIRDYNIYLAYKIINYKYLQ